MAWPRTSLTEHIPVKVLLSGGIDSTTMLFQFVRSGRRTSALFIDYRQLAVYRERRAATAVADTLSVHLEVLELPEIEPLPSGEILGRNALFVLLASAAAHARGSHIALGIHAGTPYSDCSPSFVTAMQHVLDLYHGGRVRLVAPFLNWTKKEVVERAVELRVPLEMTFSCERPSPEPCGLCLSCRDRVGIPC